MQIEGKNAVTEALKAEGVKIFAVTLAKERRDSAQVVALARAKDVKVTFADKKTLDAMSVTGRHQGFIAQSADFEYCEVDDIINIAKERNEKLFILLLDGVEDPQNLGAIIRTAECAGAHGIVIPKRRSAEVNATVLRASVGAAGHMAIARVGNINDTLRTLDDNFVTTVCADMDGECVYDAKLDGDIALVIGGEGAGVNRLTKKLCNRTISLPQFGKINSLNASVACGVLCYEIVRRRAAK